MGRAGLGKVENQIRRDVQSCRRRNVVYVIRIMIQDYAALRDIRRIIAVQGLQDMINETMLRA